MKTLSDQEHLAMLKCLCLTNLISSENDEYDEDMKQEIIKRLDKEDVHGSKISPLINWEYVFEPLGQDSYKYIKLMKAE